MDEKLSSSSRLPDYGSTSERVPDVAIVETSAGPTELFALSDKVASNVYLINIKRKDLEQYMKTIGTPKDSQELRNRVHSKLLNTNEVVESATKDLHTLTAIVKKAGKRQKLTVDKLMNEFKDAVKMYQRVQKQVVEKARTHFLPSEQALQEKMTQERSDEDSVNIQKFVADKLEFEKGLILEREQTMISIENCVIDINQIMKEIGVSVHLQGDDINSIENAIESVHENVEAGETSLEKAASYMGSRQKKTFCLLVISVVAGLVLAIIIAVSLH